jgi:hypothetical protein
MAARWEAIRTLPAAEPAAKALGTGAETYLRVHGEPAGIDSEPALRAMLERLYEDSSSFEFPEERFERVYAEVERTLYEDAMRSAIVAPVHGLDLERERVELGDGLVLAAGDRIPAPPEAVWTGRDAAPNILCVLERDVPSDAELPVTEARIRFRKLLTALRLFKPGGVALGPLAWGRADEGVWQTLPLGMTGPGRGEPLYLAPGEQDELRELVGIVAAARPGGRLAWALSRFEMGCERALDTEALSDYLLAVRALLDGGDDAGRAGLPLRLAGLCAEDGERRTVQRRLETAFSLERWLMGGKGGDAYIEEMGSDSPAGLVLEIEGHVRALIRDVLCGYLDADLKGAADDILLASEEPLEIKARDLREEAEEPEEPEPEPEHTPEPEPEPPPRARRQKPKSQLAYSPPAGAPPAVEADTAEFDAIELDDEPDEPADPEDAGVTPSADWEFDDDPASYSAPI